MAKLSSTEIYGNLNVTKNITSSEIIIADASWYPLKVVSTNNDSVGGGGIAIYPQHDMNKRTELSVQNDGLFRIWQNGNQITLHNGITHVNKLELASNQWFNNATYGIDLKNSDIVGLNNLVFTDSCDNNGEGLQFRKTSGSDANNKTSYDNLRAKDGVVYFNDATIGSDSSTYTLDLRSLDKTKAYPVSFQSYTNVLIWRGAHQDIAESPACSLRIQAMPNSWGGTASFFEVVHNRIFGSQEHVKKIHSPGESSQIHVWLRGGYTYHVINKNPSQQKAIIRTSNFVDANNVQINIENFDSSLPHGVFKGVGAVSLNSTSNAYGDTKFNFYGNIHATRVYNAVYNDYAEYFKKKDVNEYLEPGDIVVLDNNNEYIKSTKEYETTVVGVYSDSYGHILGGTGNMEEDEKNYIPVGLSGRVDVKITGKIKKGDMIVSSNIPGVGMKANEFKMGTIIGKALEDKDTIEIKKIKMLICIN